MEQQAGSPEQAVRSRQAARKQAGSPEQAARKQGSYLLRQPSSRPMYIAYGKSLKSPTGNYQFDNHYLEKNHFFLLIKSHKTLYNPNTIDI
jgi:hypothetical protein